MPPTATVNADQPPETASVSPASQSLAPSDQNTAPQPSPAEEVATDTTPPLQPSASSPAPPADVPPAPEPVPVKVIAPAPVTASTPAPALAAAVPQPVQALPPYLIQIGDVLDIKFYLNNELNEEVTVRPDGMISTGLVQDILAYGRTPGELQQALIAEYSKTLTNPKLTVIVRTFAPTHIYVLGEVNSPGEFVSVGPNLSILQAIARAGGVKNSAATDHILILRRMPGAKPDILTTSYDAAVGHRPDRDVILAPYDVVFVPRTGVADVYLYFQQYMQQFLPASLGLGYQINNHLSVQ